MIFSSLEIHVCPGKKVLLRGAFFPDVSIWIGLPASGLNLLARLPAVFCKTAVA
jgi:hypothetical protein